MPNGAKYPSWLQLRCCLLLLISALLLDAPSARSTQTAAESRKMAAHVLADAKAAMGGAKLDSIRTTDSTGTMFINRVGLSVEERDDLIRHSYLMDAIIGQVYFAGGFDGLHTWSLDMSGKSTLQMDAATLKQSITAAYDESTSYWYPGRMPGTATYIKRASEDGREFDVLEIEPKGGNPYDMWIDRTSHLIDRLVFPGTSKTSTNYVSGYREVDGTMCPFLFRHQSTLPQENFTIVVKEIKLNAKFPPGQFSPPSSRVPSLELKDSASFTVPFDLRNGHIYLPISINDQHCTAILDTGAHYAVTTNAAAKLKLAPQGTIEVTGFGETITDAKYALVSSVRIGNLTVHNPIFSVIPFSLGNFDATLGFELLSSMVVEVDYDHNTLTFTPPGQYHYMGAGTMLPIRLYGGTPLVDGAVDGIKGTFAIDSGDSLSLLLSTPFVATNDLFERYRPIISGNVAIGIGGAVHGAVTRINDFTLGSVSLHGTVTTFLQVQKGGGSDLAISGNVGEGVLHRFNVTFDYPHSQIILEPNSHYADPDMFTGIGIDVNPASGALVISAVFPNTSASIAGLKVGDTIVRVNGQPADLPTYIKAVSIPAGWQVILEINSGSITRTVPLTVADLIK